jgi:pimeloyl-ACP methyl ester carboxylesterase
VRKRLLKIFTGLLATVLLLASFVYFRPEWVADVAQRVGTRVAGIRSEDARAGPYRIHYLVGGEGRPLVLVHGLGSRAESWLPLMPALTKQHHRVYAIDLLGYGRSEKPDVDYAIGTQSSVVRDFMASQGLAQADLAGWSMGGWVALNLAAEHPELVRRLVVFDGAGMRYQLPMNPSVLRPKTPRDFDAMMAILTPHPRQIPEFLARGILRQMFETDWVTGRALDSMLTGKELLDGRLGRVTMPVLIVWGKQDVLTPLSVGESMHLEMPQSRLDVFDDCGHLAPTECRGRVLPEVLRFLEGIAPEAGGSQEFGAKARPAGS